MSNPLPIRLMAVFLLLANTSFANPVSNNPYSLPFNEIKMLSTFLYTAAGNMADGNRVVFDVQYSNNVDMWDAVKLMNPGENFGLHRNGYNLAVEARQPIKDGDTLYYKMSNLVPQVYTMSVEVQFLENTSAVAELVDRFTNTRRYINLGSNNSFPVTVTTNPASKAADRFYMVFSAMAAALPVKFTNSKAIPTADKSVTVSWTAEDEINVDRYEIERSSNGSNFETIGKVTRQSAGNRYYQYQDKQAPANSTSFYRIRAVDTDGRKTYSPILKTSTAVMSAALFTVFPNPVQGTQLNIRMQDTKPGDYQLRMLSNTGQVVYTGKFRITQNDQTVAVSLVTPLTAGIYTIAASNESGELLSKKITVQK